MNVLERSLLTRPRLLNLLHRLYFAHPLSQTNATELTAVSRHAAGAYMALEIGTFQGVSAACIASVLGPVGF